MPPSRPAQERAAQPAQQLDDPQEVPAYCAYPNCRREYRCRLGPGRRQAYCSQMCRRNAERELRQLKTRLAHLEDMVEQARIAVASYGRHADETPGEIEPQRKQRAAEDAVTRVAGILDFVGQSDDPMTRELRGLHAAVAPIIKPS